MRHSPQRTSPSRSTGPGLEPEPVVLAHRLEPAAEVDALRAGRRGEQLRERGRERLAQVERAEEVLVGGRMQAAEQRQDLLADQAALRVGVVESVAERETLGAAVRLRLLAPDGEERMDDAVVAARPRCPAVVPRETSR